MLYKDGRLYEILVRQRKIDLVLGVIINVLKHNSASKVINI